jgi:lysophospholipase L1-like esterase
MTNNVSDLVPLGRIPTIRVLGRRSRAEESGASDPSSLVTLWWAGSGIEFDFDGESVEIGLNADWDRMNPWVCVELDGVLITRTPVPRGFSRLQVFAGMNPGRKRSWHVRVLRETEPQPGDNRQLLQIVGIKGAGGQFLKMRPVTRRIEFLGDSITAGEGAIGQVHDNDWATPFFSAWNTYMRMTGEALDADFRQVAISGWGLRSDWLNNPHSTIPGIYNYVCSVLTGPKQVELGSQQQADFDDWQPDAVCINLGTNDWNAFRQPAFTDSATGAVFKEHMTDDTHYDPHDLSALAKTIQTFLGTLRRLHPHALLVFDFGMIALDLEDFYHSAVDAYAQQTGDHHVMFVHLPPLKDGWIGSHEHPGPIAHREAARVLTDALSRRLGWSAGTIHDDLTVDSPSVRPLVPQAVENKG